MATKSAFIVTHHNNKCKQISLSLHLWRHWGSGPPGKWYERYLSTMLANFRRWRGGAVPVGAGEYRIKCGACLPFCEKVNACRARNDREIRAIFTRNLHALGNIFVCGTHIELAVIPPVSRRSGPPSCPFVLGHSHGIVGINGSRGVVQAASQKSSDIAHWRFTRRKLFQCIVDVGKIQGTESLLHLLCWNFLTANGDSMASRHQHIRPQ